MEQEKRIEELERKVSKLEKEMEEIKQGQIQRNQTFSPLRQENIERQVKTADRGRIENKLSQPAVKETQPPIDWEHQIGRVWLPRIFIFVLLLGVIWGFIAAVEGGFINEQVRILLGVLGAGAMIVLGEKQIKNNRKALGQVLLGGAIGLLMLTTFAAHLLYGLIGASFAFILNIGWIVGGMYAAYRHKSEVLAILSAIAGTLVPFLIQSDQPSVEIFTAYEVALYGGFLFFALKQQYSKLYYTSAILLHVAFLIFSIHVYDFSYEILAFGAIVQHLLLVAAFMQKNLNLRQQMGVLFSSFVLTTIWMRVGFGDPYFEWAVLGSFLLYLAVGYVLREKKEDRLPIALSIASYSLMIYLITVIELEWMVILLLVEGVIAFYIGYLVNSRLQKVTGSLIYLLGGFLALPLIFEELSAILSVETLTWIVFLASLKGLDLILTKYDQEPAKGYKINSFIYVILALSSLIFITQLAMYFTEGVAEHIQHLVISFSWALYAIAGVLYGVMRSKKNVRVFGVGLLFFTLLKIIFVDLPNVPLFIRAILFIGLGAIGIFMSRMYYSKKST